MHFKNKIFSCTLHAVLLIFSDLTTWAQRVQFLSVTLLISSAFHVPRATCGRLCFLFQYMRGWSVELHQLQLPRFVVTCFSFSTAKFSDLHNYIQIYILYSSMTRQTWKVLQKQCPSFLSGISLHSPQICLPIWTYQSEQRTLLDHLLG